MTVSNRLSGLAGIITVVAMPLLLLALPLCLFVTPAFVRHEYSQRSVPRADRFGDEERLRLSDTILHYLRGKKSREALESMRTDSGELALSASEVQHLADVKSVTDAIFQAGAIAGVVQILCLVVQWQSSKCHLLPARLRQGVWLTAAFIGLVAVSAAMDFDVFFTRFHQIFFAPGTWIFDSSDTLIQLYPLPFWVDAVWKLAGVISLEMVLVYAAPVALARSVWLRSA